MSHFTKIKTKIVDRECLKKAIKALGHNYEENGELIRIQNNILEAEIAINTGNICDILCGWNGETYDIMTYHNVSAVNLNEFAAKLTQTYAYYKTTDFLREKGFVLAGEEVNEENEIILTVRQW